MNLNNKIKGSIYDVNHCNRIFTYDHRGFYLSIKYGHRLRRIKARRNCQICLVLDGSELKDIHLHCIILVFDRLGHLVRKFPEAEMRQMKGQCMLYCTVEEGILNFCVLLYSLVPSV